MNIPPITSQFFPSNPSESPVVTHLYNLWTNWYKSASQGSPDTKSATDNLLNFLKDNKNFLENMTKDTPEPFGPAFKESFSHLYSHTIARLESWEKQGCDPGSTTELSEWIGDIHYWCKAADSKSSSGF